MIDENMTRQEYREEELRDRLHEENLYDWEYYWATEVSKGDILSIKLVSRLLKHIAKYHDNITFNELEEMV